MRSPLRLTAAAVLLLALTFTLTARAQMDGDAGDQTWTIDTVHSSVVFKINHMGVAPFYGTFNQIEGAITTGGSPGFEFSIPVDSIDTRHPVRDQHVKDANLFDAAQFPTLSFKSTDVTVEGDTYHVTGDLTMHGQTNSIQVDITKTGEIQDEHMGHVVGFETTFTIRRSAYGMDKMVGPLGDEVTLLIGLEAKGN